MPRTRRPQSGVARPAGRVASTTTSSTVGVPSAQVYRIPTGKRTDCDVRNFEIAGKSPIVVRIEGTDVYRISLDSDILKGIIQGYSDLDLSRVQLTLGTVNGPLTVDGNLSIENGTFTTNNASVENLNSNQINSVEVTVQTLNADNADIKSANITEETVETSNILKAIIAEEEVTKSTVEEAVIEDATISKGNIAEAIATKETVEESEIKKATIEEESVTKSTINQLGANQAHTTSLTAVQATVSKEFISNGTAIFNGENIFNTDAQFNEDINVAGNSNLTKLNVSSTSTLDGQLNANGNANFAKNINVEGVSTLNQVNVNGYSTFQDRVTFNEYTVFNDSMAVNANATFNGHTTVKTLESTGEATFKDAVQMDKNLNVDGNAVIEGNERVDGSLSVERESEFKSHLNVNGKLTAGQNVEVAGKVTTAGIEVTSRADIANEVVDNSVIRNLKVTDSLELPDGALNQFQARSEKDQANGYAGLDENGKILMEELPDSVTTGMHYKGTWEPTSDYPSNPSLGDFYKVVAAGEKGGVSFEVGDVIIYNGASWDRIPSGDDVISVNGRSGAVTGLEEVGNKVTVLDKTNPSQTKYTSEYAVANALSAVEDKVNTNSSDISNLGDVVATKANSSDVYTKIQTDQLVEHAVENSQAFQDLKSDVNELPTKEYVDGQLNLKANVSDVYDKSVMDNLLADKAHVTHTHTISEVEGLAEQIGSINGGIDAIKDEVNDLEDEVNTAKNDILSINNTLESKADLVGGKVPASQLPDNAVTTDNVEEVVRNIITKPMLESRLGVTFRAYTIPVNSTSACYNDNWITERANVLWTWTGDLAGHISWRVEEGRICVESTENENGNFYITLIQQA